MTALLTLALGRSAWFPFVAGFVGAGLGHAELAAFTEGCKAKAGA